MTEILVAFLGALAVVLVATVPILHSQGKRNERIITELAEIKSWQATHQTSHDATRREWLEETEANRQVRADMMAYLSDIDERVVRLESRL